MVDSDNVVPISAEAKEPARAPEVPADDQLRAFEDKHFGKDVPRYEGRVERGHGSRYQRLDASARAEHAALERLVDAEEHVQKALRELSHAQARHAAAKAAVAGHAAK